MRPVFVLAGLILSGFVLIVFAGLVLVGCNPTKPQAVLSTQAATVNGEVVPVKEEPEADQADEPVVIDSTELLSAFREDEAAANKLYLKKRVRVRGTVTGTLGDKTILLETLPAITVFLVLKHDVSKGDTVTTDGIVSLGNGGGVHIKDAKLISVGQPKRGGGSIRNGNGKGAVKNPNDGRLKENKDAGIKIHPAGGGRKR